MLFERKTIIESGNIYLEMAALHNILKDLESCIVFREDGVTDEYYNEHSMCQSYDGNPKHLIDISFSTIRDYCKEHNLKYCGGTTIDTGMDMCMVSKKKKEP